MIVLAALRIMALIFATVGAVKENAPLILFAIFLWMVANTSQVNYTVTNALSALKERDRL